jgi:alpha-glucosidase
MTGRIGAVDELGPVARTIRATMAATRPDTYLVAEHCYDASSDLRGDGWHGTMAYSGFTRPVWSWLADPAAGAKLMGFPGELPHLHGGAVAATMQEQLASMPWRSTAASLTLLDSHDTARFRTVANDADRHVAAVGLLATYPGVPMVFAGDEVGLEGSTSDDGRRPMQWDPRRWDERLLSAFRDLLHLRRSSPALQRGGLRWAHAGDDTLVFLREARDERVLVAVSRAAHEPVVLDACLLGLRDTVEALYGDAVLFAEGDKVALPAPSEAAVHVWRLDP